MREPTDTYCKFVRKIIGHPIVWDFPYSRFQAWTWLILKAKWSSDGLLKRGELIAGRAFLAKTWGWGESTVVRFLSSLQDDGMISTNVLCDTSKLLKADLNCSFFDTSKRTSKINRYTIITITNYNQYQGVCGTTTDTTTDTTGDTTGDTIKKEGTKKVQKRTRSTPLPPKPVASHDLEILKEQLSEINIPDFVKRYEPQGLDVVSCFDDFTDYVLNGTAKNQTPNQANWIVFSRAFHDSCKRAIEKGRHQLKEPPPKTPSLAERMGYR